MNTNFIRPIAQPNKSLKNKKSTCLEYERKTKTVSDNGKHIFEPIVEIKSESQDFSENASVSKKAELSVPNFVNCPKVHRSDNTTGASDTMTSAKEKYVFVIMNNVARATSPDGPMRIVDIKSAISARHRPLGNVTVQNVTFSADNVRNTVSEVIENLPGEENIDLNSSEVNHEYLLVLNCSIPFDINDASLENPNSLTETQSSNNKLYHSIKDVSKFEASQVSLNHVEQSVPTLVNNEHYEKRISFLAPEKTVKMVKDENEEGYLKDNQMPETSLGREKDISDEDDIYILVVDDDCDNSEIVESSDQSDDDNGEYQEDSIDFCENEGGIESNNKKSVHFKGCKKQYFCNRCKESFISMKCLRQHIMRKCCRNSNVNNAKMQQETRGIDGARRSKSLQQVISDNKPPHDRTGFDKKYVACSKCKGVFKNKKMLKQHILISCSKVKVADRKRKMCEICGKVYYKTSHFRYHMEAHANLRQLKCPECPSRFNSRCFLTKHIDQVHRKSKLYKYFCSFCGLKSESKEHIQMHEQVHTLPEGAEVPHPYECLCGKSFISKYALRCHKNSTVCHIHNKMMLNCPLCDEQLATAHSMSLHLKGKHNVKPTKGERTVGCDRCDKKFTWFGSYVRHKLVAHLAEVSASEVEPYIGQSASLPGQYRPRFRSQRPQRPQEEPTEPQVCNLCDTVCKSKRALYTHKSYHHNENRKIKLLMESTVPVLCDLCDKVLPNKYSLSKHNFRHHRPREPGQLTCRICHKEFDNYGGLWSHNKYVHVNTLLYDCVVCGSKFKRKGDHTRHLKDKHGIVKSGGSVEEEYKVEAIQF